MKPRPAGVPLAVALLLTVCQATGASPVSTSPDLSSALPAMASDAAVSAGPTVSLPAGFEPIDDGTLPPGDYATVHLPSR